MFISQVTFFYSLGWAVISSFWQIALLWLIYKLVIAALSIKNPTFKTSLASALLLAGFSCVVFTLLTTNQSNSNLSSFTIAGSAYTITNPVFYQLLPYASYVYLILLLFPGLQFFKNYRYAQTIRQYRTTKPDVGWKLFIQRWAPLMGISKKITVLASDFINSPLTVGFFKPVILLPLSVLSHLSPQQVEALLLHELSHIRRNDYLMNFIIQFIRTILYFNPFVKAFVKEIEKEREKSCDSMVLQCQYNPYEYASALLLLQQVKEPVFCLAASGKNENLLDRINLIVGTSNTKNKRINYFTFFAVLLALLFFSISFNNAKEIIRPLATSGIVSSPSFAVITPQPEFAVSVPASVKSKTAVAKEKKNNNIETAGEKQTGRITNSSATDNGYSFATNRDFIIPELKNYQDEQVKAAIEFSKRIVEEMQWKQFEKSLAEVFTSEEKKLLHGLFSKKMDKYNWGPLENRLRTGYENIDWENLNNQLNKEVVKIQLDSIKTSFTESLTKLDKAGNFLKENNSSGLPDTDITLQVIEERKKQISKLLNNLQDIRSRKIIKL